MTLLYWSVRSSNKGEVDGVKAVNLAHCDFNFINFIGEHENLGQHPRNNKSISARISPFLYSI